MSDDRWHVMGCRHCGDHRGEWGRENHPVPDDDGTGRAGRMAEWQNDGMAVAKWRNGVEGALAVTVVFRKKHDDKFFFL